MALELKTVFLTELGRSRLYGRTSPDSEFHPVVMHGLDVVVELVEWTDEDVETVEEFVNDGILSVRIGSYAGDPRIVIEP